MRFFSYLAIERLDAETKGALRRKTKGLSIFGGTILISNQVLPGEILFLDTTAQDLRSRSHLVDAREGV